jgi:hypothetical protein
VDLLLDDGFLEWGLFSVFMFSDLSSPLIYPPGLMRWSERQVLVDVGREHANVISFRIQIPDFEIIRSNAPKPLRTNRVTLGDLLGRSYMCCLPNPSFVTMP